jgi:chromosome segregation ATPase
MCSAMQQVTMLYQTIEHTAICRQPALAKSSHTHLLKSCRWCWWCAGDQVELLLQNEAALKDSAAQQQAALQEALEAAQQQAAGLQQECEALRGQLAAAQRELEAQERGHKKVLKKLDKKMLQVGGCWCACV